jgi:1,4-dihydroxy-2-naphthoyl-CoA hydrolase|tara:strand:- start:365 stop:811 length:447 start_codon:yes stop_codon:yes gene_type:complete
MTAPDLEIRNPKFIDHMVGHRSESGIDGFLGATVVEMEAGRLVVEFAVGDEHLTFIGNMHGGCLAALCDHCLGVVLYPVMPPGSWAATTEFKVNYLRPVSGGTCRATAVIESMTKRSAVVTIRVENEGRLAAIAQGTCTVKLVEEKVG